MRLSKRRTVFALLAVFWAGFILARSMQPAAASNEESDAVRFFLQDFLPWLHLSVHVVRKAAHVTEFAIFAMLLAGTLGRRYMAWTAFGGLLLALCDETVQLAIPGRSGQVSDVWIDFAGVLLGMALAAAVAAVYAHRRK